MFVEGCLFFLWQPLFEYYWAHPPERMEFWIAKMPILMGTTIFGAGIYMGYVELINMDTDTSLTRPNFFWCDWKGLYRLLQQREEGESDRGDAESDSSSEVYWYQPLSSIAGWLIYVAGAILYQVANVADMFDLEEDQHDYLVGWPLVFGGLSFFLGGCCELIHNRCWATAPNTFVWWSSVCNFVGGIGFWFCACPGIFTGYTTLIGVQGTVLYLIGAILGLCMWRTEQFGLSLISNLNRVHRVGGTQIAVRTEKTTGAARDGSGTDGTDGLTDRRIDDREEMENPSRIPTTCAPRPVICEAFKLDDVDNVLEDKLSWRGLSFVVMHLISQEMTSIAHAIGAVSRAADSK
ncbi:Copia protein [Durusdinium trenchii]|uniref:Copia protein n=1 Tax=Durusdinium trenchii TaxID=1381693 RepID=A0ABP0PW07_9DINO